MEAGTHPSTEEVLTGEIIPPEPKPGAGEVQALNRLLKSEWFHDEMENANYHSAYEFLGELQDIAATHVAEQEKPA